MIRLSRKQTVIRMPAEPVSCQTRRAPAKPFAMSSARPLRARRNSHSGNTGSMTYLHRLARRIARFRVSVSTCVGLSVACSQGDRVDFLSPFANPNKSVLSSVQIEPKIAAARRSTWRPSKRAVRRRRLPRINSRSASCSRRCWPAAACQRIPTRSRLRCRARCRQRSSRSSSGPSIRTRRSGGRRSRHLRPRCASSKSSRSRPTEPAKPCVPPQSCCNPTGPKDSWWQNSNRITSKCPARPLHRCRTDSAAAQSNAERHAPDRFAQSRSVSHGCNMLELISVSTHPRRNRSRGLSLPPPPGNHLEAIQCK